MTQEEREAEDALRALRRRGLSRDAIGDELVAQGYSRFEANCLLDGYGLPERPASSAPTGTDGLDEVDDVELPPPSGIGGWLILPAIGLVLSPLILIRALADDLRVLYAPELDEVEAMWPGLTRALQLEIGANVFTLALGLVAAFFFFTRRRNAPRAMILLHIVEVVLVVATTAYTASVIPDPGEPIGALGALVAAAIWIPYFLVSERVKNTFVR